MATSATPEPGIARALLFAAWLVATVSTLGALFLSEIMAVAPCVLCWYQRGFMFPLVFVLAAGLFPLDPPRVALRRPFGGGGLARRLVPSAADPSYIPETMTPCTQGIPCSKIDVEWFGFLTIPMLSVLSFSAIGLALGAFHHKARP